MRCVNLQGTVKRLSQIKSNVDEKENTIHSLYIGLFSDRK